MSATDPSAQLAESRRLMRRDPATAWSLADQVLAAASPSSPLATDALIARAQAAFYQMGFEGALEDGDRALAAARFAGDPVREALALSLIGKVHGRCDRYLPALEALHAARSGLEAAGHDTGLLEVFLTLGNIYNGSGETVLAAESYAKALDLSRKLGDLDAVAHMLNNLANIEQRYGRLEQARTYLIEAETHYLNIQDRLGLCLVRYNLAEVQRAARQLPGLIEAYQAVLDEERALANRFMMAACLRGLAETHLLHGDIPAADRAWHEALDLFSNLPMPGYEARLRTDFARHLLLHTRDPAAATRELERATALESRAPSLETRASLLEVRALLQEHEGDLAGAITSLRELRETDSKLQAEQGRRHLEALAVLHRVAASERETEAARRHGEALANALADAERQRNSAEAANRFKSDMLRMAAHDVRAPLNAVIGFLSIAREDLALLPGLNPETLGLLADAESSAQRGVRTLARILDAALLESDSLQLERETFDPLDWAHEVIRESRVLAAAKGQHLLCEGPAGRALCGDRILLSEALQNLIGNAIKFGPVGQSVQVRLIPHAEVLEVTVDDEGPGVENEDAQLLFQPFMRGRARPSGGEESFGLGLALVRGLVEAHRGSVGAASRDPGPGARFWMRLPWA